MVKKFILLIIILAFIGGGFFYWWNSQVDVRELNKTLPKEVKVVKSLFGDEYRVVNKIDNYEFKIPPEWQGVKEIEYIPVRTEEGYTAASISIEGREGVNRTVTIDRFRIEELDLDLKQWAENNFETFGLIGDFIKDEVDKFDVVKTKESVHLFDVYIFFFKKESAIYAITNQSEKIIRYIITNGKW